MINWTELTVAISHDKNVRLRFSIGFDNQLTVIIKKDRNSTLLTFTKI